MPQVPIGGESRLGCPGVTMFKKEESLTAQWGDSLLEQEGDKLVLLPSFDYPREIVQVDIAMRALVKSKQVLFSMRTQGSRTFLHVDPIAKAVRQCSNIDYAGIQAFYSKHKLSPYFQMLSREFTSLKAAGILGKHAEVDVANAWIERIRKEARSSAFTALLTAQERSARKNARAVIRYLRELHVRNSRLCVVRVDLAHSSEYRKSLAGGEVDPVRIKAELEVLLRQLRNRYPALVGYVWKLEYGQLKSYHIHLMLIFNGNEVRQDVVIGRAVGELWRDQVTGGDGGYWNCNAQKLIYERGKGVGIGMVAYDDADKRLRLEHAVLYLTKVDYYVKLNEPAIGRTFGKGQLSAARNARRGRPRQVAA